MVVHVADENRPLAVPSAVLPGPCVVLCGSWCSPNVLARPGSGCLPWPCSACPCRLGALRSLKDLEGSGRVGLHAAIPRSSCSSSFEASHVYLYTCLKICAYQTSPASVFAYFRTSLLTYLPTCFALLCFDVHGFTTYKLPTYLPTCLLLTYLLTYLLAEVVSCNQNQLPLCGC